MVSCVAWTWVNPPKARRSLDNIIYNSVYSEAPLPRFSCFKLLQEGKHSGCLIWIIHATFCSVNSSTHLKSLICHHFPSSSLLRFFKIMKHHKKASWFINRILFLYFQFTIFSLLSTILEVLNVQWGRPWRLYPFKGAVVNNPTRSPMALGKEATWFDSAWSSATWVNISSICNRLITIKKKDAPFGYAEYPDSSQGSFHSFSSDLPPLRSFLLVHPVPALAVAHNRKQDRHGLCPHGALYYD